MDIHDRVGLINGALIEFYGFVGDKKSTGHDRIFHPPQYMLVKILDGPVSELMLSGLPRGVVLMAPVEFTHREGGRKTNRQGRWVKLSQFEATLAYAITDYSTRQVNPATTDFRDRVGGTKVTRSRQPRIQSL